MLSQIISSSLLIAVVVIVRGIFGKHMKQRTLYALWLFVAAKLLLPISIENPILITNYLIKQERSIERIASYNNEKTLENRNIPKSDKDGDKSSTEEKEKSKEGIVQDKEPGEKNQGLENSEKNHFFDQVFVSIWIIGIVLTGSILFMSNLHFYFQVKKERIWEKTYKDKRKVFRSSYVNGPCLFGIVFPAIYIPFHWKLTEEQEKYILLHEWMHYRHKDVIWSLVRCICFMVYWFHPFVWVACYLSKKDCETACDEGVLAQIDKTEKSTYGRILVDLCALVSKHQKTYLLMQEFGGGNKEMKRRLQFIVKKTGSGAWLTMLAGVIMISAAGCTFGTQMNTSQKSIESTSETLLDKHTNTESEIAVKEPDFNLSDTAGADGAMLYYADENTIIFGGYFGMFVYDTQNMEMYRSLDLKSIGCDATQGDNYCEIYVSEDGEIVYLHAINTNALYIYHVAENNLEKTEFHPDILEKTVLYSGADKYAGVATCNAEGEKVVLHHKYGMIGQLAYEYADSGFSRYFFVPDEYQKASVLKRAEVSEIAKIEMFIEGQLYSCDSEIALAYLETQLEDAEAVKGGSGCPFYDELYLTLQDGTVGVIYPATDSCNIILTQDGYFQLSSANNSKFWKLLGWDPEVFRS